MGKKLLYMVVDTETATLGFVNDLAKGDAEKKKRMAIAKPLVYDIGWTICDRQGNLHEKKQFLIAETFAVPSIFNTAYYTEKRPIYLEMIKNGEIEVKPWFEVMEVFVKDLEKVNAVGAFNSMFDFKKAIPFTELYINKLYSPDYYDWENRQKNICLKIMEGKNKNKKDMDFEADIFRFRGSEYILFDLWGLATTYLLNNATYKNRCIEYNMLTQSGTFFKTSAETSYRYLCDKYDFIESHTALDDAIIESFILHKIAQKHAITPGIKFFPFKDLGYTDEFCMRRKKPNYDECKTVYDAIMNYVDVKGESNYTKGLVKRLKKLAAYMGM